MAGRRHLPQARPAGHPPAAVAVNDYELECWYETPGDAVYPRFPDAEVLDVEIEDE